MGKAQGPSVRLGDMGRAQGPSVRLGTWRELRGPPSDGGTWGELGSSLTLSAPKTAVVAHGAEELEDEHGHSHHGQAHDKHHHPHSRTVGLYGGEQIQQTHDNVVRRRIRNAAASLE